MLKSEARRLGRANREQLSESEITEKSRLIADKLFTLDVYKEADNILAYVSARGEVDTSAIITNAKASGKRVFVPKVYGRDMEFVQIEGMSDLKEGYMGILEPVRDEPVYSSEGGGRTIIIMPGVAFDRGLHRAGYGGGFYDRYLERFEGLYRVAICFDCQIVENFEVESTDISPDLLISEKELLRWTV